MWSKKYECDPKFNYLTRQIVALKGPGGVGLVKRTYKGDVKLRLRERDRERDNS